MYRVKVKSENIVIPFTSDAQTSQTGYGRPCSSSSDCIQGGKEMRCGREMSSDPSKMCLCAEDSYQRGFTCKKSK